jgi:hypothetical protein
MTELFEGGSVTIWIDEFDGEQMVTIRIGMTTIQMPKSVFLELHGGLNESFKKIELSDEKLT